MGRREERIFRMNDEIGALQRDEELAAEELIMLQHLDDDAQRDAAAYDEPRTGRTRERRRGMSREWKATSTTCTMHANALNENETGCCRSSVDQ